MHQDSHANTAGYIRISNFACLCQDQFQISSSFSYIKIENIDQDSCTF